MANRIESANLIDLSFEDEAQSTEKQGPELMQVHPAISILKPIFMSSCPLSSSSQAETDYLDNNPFDCVQTLSNRPDDPFEIVEKAAYNKFRNNSQQQAEVKIGKLLSLSDDNLLDDEDTNCDFLKPNTTGFDFEKSTVKNGDILELQDSLISALEHSTPEMANSDTNRNSESSGELNKSSDSGVSHSFKTKRALEYRRRLLKLSISNSSVNSPLNPSQSENEKENYSPLSTIFYKAAREEEQSLAAESPLKLIDDDLMSEASSGQRNATIAENNFDADLEMLKIPILKELASPVITESLPQLENTALVQSPAMADLTAIRAKLQEKRQENSNNHQNISALIQNLKSVIHNINVIDDDKKREASTLLETLSSAFESNKKADAKVNQEERCTARRSVIRQDTFDIDLQKTCNEVADRKLEPSSLESGNVHHSVYPTHLSECTPDVMIRSSETYDGEPAEEKRDYALPNIDPLSPVPVEDHNINDIVEQIAKLLEHHQLTQQPIANNASEDPSANITQPLNPTYIVVMNTSMQPSPSKQNDSSLANVIDGAFNYAAPQLRRRSQSLSIHDKIKIVQVSLPTPSQAFSDDQYESPPTTTPPEFKTPLRTVQRRNTFSNGTPVSSANASSSDVVLKRVNNGSETVTRNTNFRRLETHHEHQQQPEQGLMRPLPLPRTSFHTFKPELKRKPCNIVGNSIMGSTGPLKATIPVKKVAPMMKTSSQLYNESECSTQHGTFNTTMQFGMTMPHTSTPMPAPRNVEFPNASSTPAAHTSPISRNRQGIIKPRYSYSAASPGTKATSATTVATAGVKRRSLNEMSMKTPVKSRLSSYGVGTSSGINTQTYKTAMKSSGSNSSSLKTSIKTTSSTASSRTMNKSAVINSLTKGGTNTEKKNQKNKGP